MKIRDVLNYCLSAVYNSGMKIGTPIKVTSIISHHASQLPLNHLAQS